MDRYIVDKGRDILLQAEDIVQNMDYSKYVSLIKRSINRYEICLGKVDNSNICIKENGVIEIGTIKYMTYNLIEHDLYNLIRYAKRKLVNMNYKELLERYVEELELSDLSYEYIDLWCKFPIEQLKVWNKYRKTKIESNEKYLTNMIRAKEFDNIYK